MGIIYMSGIDVAGRRGGLVEMLQSRMPRVPTGILRMLCDHVIKVGVAKGQTRL